MTTCHRLAWILAPLCALGAAWALAQKPAGPVAWFRFQSQDALGTDAVAGGPGAAVTEARWDPAREGGGMALDGRGGLQVPAERLHAAGGFGLDCWFRLATADENMSILAKEGEYLVRVDPPAEGASISFYVNAGGSLEPRVRGPRAQAGTWTHLLATWDGERATLWVNGQQFSVQRRGEIAPTDSPVLVGFPSHFGPVGLKGVMAEVKLYDHPLSDQEVLLAEYGLDRAPAGPRLAQARFEFTRDAGGWEGREAGELRVAGGRLVADLPDGRGLLMQRRLDVPLSGGELVCLRLAAARGTEAKLVYLTTQGLEVLPFALKADGALHSYVLSPGQSPAWAGRLRALALAPSDAGGRVEVDFVRVAATAEAPPEVSLEELYLEPVIPRAGRPCELHATFHNTGGDGLALTATLTPPPGVSAPAGTRLPVVGMSHDEIRRLDWQVVADQAGEVTLPVRVTGEGVAPAERAVTVTFCPPVTPTHADYVPEPQIPPSQYLVGCHYCPLWRQGTRGAGGWQEIVPFPERKPALGWYNEGDPEVTDWDIKWALEHGIQYFVYCWYRQNQGHGVQHMLSHAIEQGLMHARYGSKFKFTIMWENQSRGQAGVSSEDDLVNTLLPYWIEHYFKSPMYLKIDNKPLLFIYRPEFLVDDLGGVANVRRALDRVREACRRAGFAGLTILGEYRGTDPAPLQLMVDEGLDYSFAYCWPVGGHPTGQQAIREQERFWQEWRRMNIIPGLVTVSMGWDATPWGGAEGSIWRLKPEEFRQACLRARAFMATLPQGSLGRKLVLLDNWDEFGEGHYIAPHRQYGFGYLDAVRAAFTDATGPHVDLVPEDVGRGPYDSLFRQVQETEQLCRKKVVAPSGVTPDLLGWWTFGEAEGAPVAWDWSGHELGGLVADAKRVPGRQGGKALECHGGSVTIPGAGKRFGLREITVECWVKTDVAGQTDRWFVNNLYDGGLGGFRLGLAQGKLCWAVPKTPWSHHMTATVPLPTGRWVHVAATSDGHMLRLYMDGREVASLERFGPVYSNNWPLCLGSYEKGHQAFFTGLLADVRIHSRALTPEQIAAQAKQ